LKLKDAKFPVEIGKLSRISTYFVLRARVTGRLDETGTERRLRYCTGKKIVVSGQILGEFCGDLGGEEADKESYHQRPRHLQESVID
jgi:hypothetical protein